MDELTIASAQPFPYKMPSTGRVALIMIDWQRDFLDEGGFGHALGNNVSTLRRGLGPAAAVLTAARACGVPIVHTLEAHKPDLSDLPAAKLLRCPAIGKVLEAEPARGRLLIAGEPGNAIVNEVAPIAGELVLHKPGKGAFCGTALHEELRTRGVTHLLVTGVTTEVCVQSTPAGSTPWPNHPRVSAAPATRKPGEVPRRSATSALESDHPIPPLYLHFISPISPLYLPYISAISPLESEGPLRAPLRANRYAARGQRPRVRLPGGERRDRVVLPALQAGDARDGRGAGRHRRLGRPLLRGGRSAARARTDAATLGRSGRRALGLRLPAAAAATAAAAAEARSARGLGHAARRLRAARQPRPSRGLRLAGWLRRLPRSQGGVGVRLPATHVPRLQHPSCPACNPTCLRPTSTSRRRGAASTAACPMARRASTQPTWSRATGETPTCTPSTSCTRCAP